tara:strand:+ start:1282 stop:1755 length:474 start_codon:yes stop_codon:yes gene_type:complete
LDDKTIAKSLIDLATKLLGGSEGPSEDVKELPVVKALQEDKRLFTAVVLRPDDVDAHGDIYDAEVVEKACHDYNEFCSEGNIQHLIQTKLVVPVESYIAKADMTLGEGSVKTGDWLMTVRVDDEDIWEMCKKGEFTGFSIGCLSLVETLEEGNDSET